MKTHVRYLLSSPLLSLALLFGTLFATANSQALDPWSDPQIVRAVFALNLADDQKPLFASAVEDCLQGYMSDVKKLMRANNQTDLDRKLAKKRKSRLKALDDAMAKVLTEPQKPSYEEFRTLLNQKIDQQG